MKFLKLPKKDIRMEELINNTDQKTLAKWAIDCLERFMPLLENKYPDEKRPRTAINVLKSWINDEITMWEARKYCWKVLDFAREIEQEDKMCCQIARACSHTLATCHVPRHCEGVTIYTLSALQYEHINDENVSLLMERERQWQVNHLIELKSEL